MSRRPRLQIADVPLHIIQRGINRADCFFSRRDGRVYLEELGEACEANLVSLHAYCLMTNHVHLLLTPATEEGPSRMMKRLGERYVRYINRTRNRTGTLWEGRFRSCPVESDAYLLTCSRYIELNPCRAGIVAEPFAYSWSSHRANAHGVANPLLKPHSLYLTLGATPAERQNAYRAMFEIPIPPAEIDLIRSQTNGGYALGTPSFHDFLQHRFNRPTDRRPTGRPKAGR